MKKLIIYFAVLTMANACIEDVPLKIENTVGVLCINGYFYSDSDSNCVYVTTTGTENPHNVTNATVSLSVNGANVETKTQSDSLSGRYYYLKTILKPGDEVRIDAYLGDKHAYYEGVMPKYVNNFEVSSSVVKNKPFLPYYEDRYQNADMICFEVKFDDVSSESNYYRLYANSDCGYYTIYRDYVEVLDTIYFDGEPYISERYEYVDIPVKFKINSYLYYRDEVLLTDEEFTGADDFMDGIYNNCHVFKNSRFRGGKCNLKFYRKIDFDYDYETGKTTFPPDTYFFTDSSQLAFNKTYFYTETVGIELYNPDSYYYFKSLNAYDSGVFDNQELTGSVKMRSNVNGGSGNITLVSRVSKQIVFYDNYTPNPVRVEEEDLPDNIYYK